MKTVFNNSMVYHVYAQQEQADGRNSGGSMSFHGTRAYSYSTCIGQFIVGEKTGNRYFIMNDTRYSNTTARHQSKLRSAIHSAEILCIANVRSGTDFLSLERVISHHLANVEASRSVAFHRRDIEDGLSMIKGAIKEANQIFSRLSRDIDVPAPIEFDEEKERQAILDAKESQKVESAEKAKRTREEKKIMNELLEQIPTADVKELAKILSRAEKLQREFYWKVKASHDARRDEIFIVEAREKLAPLYNNNFGEFVRQLTSGDFSKYASYSLKTVLSEVCPIKKGHFAVMDIDGDEIKTSQGAEFPLSHFILACKRYGKDLSAGAIYTDKKPALGDFKIDEIENGVIYAGCHAVPVKNVYWLAEKLGVEIG